MASHQEAGASRLCHSGSWLAPLSINMMCFTTSACVNCAAISWGATISLLLKPLHALKTVFPASSVAQMSSRTIQTCCHFRLDDSLHLNATHQQLAPITSAVERCLFKCHTQEVLVLPWL
ncbi:hypothetical protein RRG08_044754 [Elysia crispata]|uniref:Uncharacterized protein n=1 Tax=Elysia crispata TaxID=231223 RepID=A0AAE1DG89_9GAST|nr:hypothetical protein RRG08_044754 [Elysia crispata]